MLLDACTAVIEQSTHTSWDNYIIQVGWTNLIIAIIIALFLVIAAIWTFKKTKLGNTADIDLEPIVKAYEFQTKNNRWNFMQEREYVENLFCQRINFLILSFSLFVTAFASLDAKPGVQIIILLVGFIVTIPLSIIAVRAYKKLDIHLKITFNLEEDTNPMTIVDKMVKNGFHGKSKIDGFMESHLFDRYNRLVGLFLPKIICFLYLFGAGTIGILMLLGVY